jgi:hypothetical protein
MKIEWTLNIGTILTIAVTLIGMLIAFHRAFVKGIHDHIDRVAHQVTGLDKKITNSMDKLEIKVDDIDTRVTVVETHLGFRRMPGTTKPVTP